MENRPRPYLAYLLRLQMVEPGSRPTWRVTLQAPGDPTLHHFETFEAAIRFIEAQMITAEHKLKGK